MELKGNLQATHEDEEDIVISSSTSMTGFSLPIHLSQQA